MTQILVQASDFDSALANFKKGMEGTMADYEIASIAETLLMDVFGADLSIKGVKYGDMSIASEIQKLQAELPEGAACGGVEISPGGGCGGGVCRRTAPFRRKPRAELLQKIPLCPPTYSGIS